MAKVFVVHQFWSNCESYPEDCCDSDRVIGVVGNKDDANAAIDALKTKQIEASLGDGWELSSYDPQNGCDLVFEYNKGITYLGTNKPIIHYDGYCFYYDELEVESLEEFLCRNKL